MKNNFKDNARWLRIENGLKQAEIAAIFNLPRTTWASYEAGKSKPNIELIVRIANYFDLKVEEIVMKDLAKVRLSIFDETKVDTKDIKKRRRPGNSKEVNSVPVMEPFRPEDKDPHLQYKATGEWTKDKSIAEVMKEVFEIFNDFKEQIESLKQQDRVQSVETYKAAFEAEKRNRELLEEKLKRMDKE